MLLWFGLSEGISEKFRGECHDCFYGMAVSECGEGVETGLRFYYQPQVEQQAHYEHPLKHAEQGSGYSVEPPEVEGMGHILEKVSHGFHPEESGDEHYYVGYDRVDICRGFACGVGAISPASHGAASLHRITPKSNPPSAPACSIIPLRNPYITEATKTMSIMMSSVVIGRWSAFVSG